MNRHADQLLPVPRGQRNFDTIFIVQSRLERDEIRVLRQWRRGHLAEPMIGLGMERWTPRQVTDSRLGIL